MVPVRVKNRKWVCSGTPGSEFPTVRVASAAGGPARATLGMAATMVLLRPREVLSAFVHGLVGSARMRALAVYRQFRSAYLVGKRAQRENLVGFRGLSTHAQADRPTGRERRERHGTG